MVRHHHHDHDHCPDDSGDQLATPFAPKDRAKALGEISTPTSSVREIVVTAPRKRCCSFFIVVFAAKFAASLSAHLDEKSGRQSLVGESVRERE
jgi:hypothetical protein